MGVKAFKTGSGEMMNYSIINKILRTKKPLMMSSGMSLKEIDEMINYLKLNKSKFIILNCSIYPCPYNKVNLGFIDVLKKKYDILVGHSDHTPDYWTAIGAANKGAVLVEKHFTLSRELKGPDYQVSLELKSLKQWSTLLKSLIKLANQKKIYLKRKKLFKNGRDTQL